MILGQTILEIYDCLSLSLSLSLFVTNDDDNNDAAGGPFCLKTMKPSLPLDEAIASRAVIVIVSESDWGKTDGLKRFLEPAI